MKLGAFFQKFGVGARDDFGGERENARSVILRELPNREARLKDYVPRLVYLSGTNPEAALIRRRLLARYGEGGDDVISDEDFLLRQRTILIGNAGSGKSVLLSFAYVHAAHAFLRQSSDAYLPFWLDLGNDLGTDLSIEKALNRKYSGLFGRIALLQPSRLILLLDNLEGALRRNDLFYNDLTDFCRAFEGLLRISVACRRPSWNPQRFAESRFEVFHIDYLGDDDYAKILPDRELRRTFFDQCSRRGIKPLLEVPFHGFYFAREFAAGNPLPPSRREAMEARTVAALRSTESSGTTLEAPPIDRLEALAGCLASIAVFAGRARWTEQEAIDLLGSAPNSNSGSFNSDVRTLLSRVLFFKDSETYAFSHEIYQEYLAARAIAPLRLRKQRQLLEADVPALKRIATRYRGVAVHLAECSQEFAVHLIAHDPLTLFLSEPVALTPEQDDALVYTAIDQAIAEQRAPWWGIPPRGDSLFDSVPRHRPLSVRKFIEHLFGDVDEYLMLWSAGAGEPYLYQLDEIRLLWITGCLSAWGGDRYFNRWLFEVARDKSRNIEARKWAINAIDGSGGEEAVLELPTLLEDPSDQIRGAAISALRSRGKLSPSQLVGCLLGGRRQQDTVGQLTMEARGYGLYLDKDELAETLDCLASRYRELRDLAPVLLIGLLQRAAELSERVVPASLFPLTITSYDAYAHEALERFKSLMIGNAPLFRAVFLYLVEFCEQTHHPGLPHFSESDAARELATVCTDDIFDLLPADPTALGAARFFVLRLLTFYFLRDASSARLKLFRERAPQLCHHLTLPPQAPRQKPRLPDSLRINAVVARELVVGKIRSRLNSNTNDIYLTKRFLETFETMQLSQAEGGHRQKHVTLILNQLTSPLRDRLLDIFQSCVAFTDYRRIFTGPRTFTMTDPELEIPFWIARADGRTFPVAKLAEVVRCYWWNSGGDKDPYLEVLTEIHERDATLWSSIVIDLINNDPSLCPILLRHLQGFSDDRYAGECEQRLRNLNFTSTEFRPLIDYLLLVRPNSVPATMWECYNGLLVRLPLVGPPEPEAARNGLTYLHQFEPLLVLMSLEDGSAWTEFDHRLTMKDVPTADDLELLYGTIRKMRSPAELRIVADWLWFVKESADSDRFAGERLSAQLLNLMMNAEPSEAMREFERLRRSTISPTTSFLSFYIIVLNERLLVSRIQEWPAQPLIQFITEAALAIVRSDRELFEWVTDALEEVRRDLERGEGTAGYWDNSKPKIETDCQNVLWPLIRQKLTRVGVTGVEERFVAANKCDFWVELPRQNEQPFVVIIELKTARKSYNRDDLVKPIESQLWDKYLRPSDNSYGIHVVLWFKKNSYPFPNAWETPNELSEEIARQAEDTSALHRVAVQTLLIDLTAEWR